MYYRVAALCNLIKPISTLWSPILLFWGPPLSWERTFWRVKSLVILLVKWAGNEYFTLALSILSPCCTLQPPLLILLWVGLALDL